MTLLFFLFWFLIGAMIGVGIVTLIHWAVYPPSTLFRADHPDHPLSFPFLRNSPIYWRIYYSVLYRRHFGFAAWCRRYLCR